MKRLTWKPKKIARDLGIADRTEVMAQAEAVITLKDHKDRRMNDRPCRLINPAKSEVGKVSKVILESITKDVRTATTVNLWRSSTAVIDWFDGIDGKDECTFVVFDVVEFYPSISEELLEKALDSSSPASIQPSQSRTEE